MLLTGLSEELLNVIIQSLDSQGALCSLSRTCKLFNRLCEPRLYRDIRLGYPHTRVKGFVAALASNRARETHVRSVEIDYEPSPDYRDRSACTEVRSLAALNNLEILSLHSGYWHWDDNPKYVRRDPGELVNWSTDQDKLDQTLKEASIARPVGERVWPNLKVLVLDFWEQNGQGWFLAFEPAVFLLASLRELTICGVRYHDGDGVDLVDSPFKGEMPLESLTLKRSYLYHEALRRFLAMPKALKSLRLEHDEGYWHHEMGDDSSKSRDAEDYMVAFRQQQHSLKNLMVQDLYDELETGTLDFRGFEKLQSLGSFSVSEDVPVLVHARTQLHLD